MNLIDLYFDTKRYNDAIETCEKFMDLTGPEEVENAQAVRARAADAGQGALGQDRRGDEHRQAD